MADPALNPAEAPSAYAEGPQRAADKSPEAARAAAQEFEAFFLAQVLDQMFAGIPTDAPFGGGTGEGVFRDMLNQEYGKIISRAGGVGIADAVYREMLRLQEHE